MGFPNNFTRNIMYLNIFSGAINSLNKIICKFFQGLSESEEVLESPLKVVFIKDAQGLKRGYLMNVFRGPSGH